MIHEPFYFLHLAKNYLAEIDDLLPQVPASEHGELPSTSLVVTVRKQASYLTLKIKLLFQEFDKGELFL